MKMVYFLPLFFFYFLLCFTFTAKSQEPMHLAALQPPSAAVHVEPHHLTNVSGSVLAAENWLRSHVLALYPASNITTILVGSAVSCRGGSQQHDDLGLILLSIKNLHHSLTRWGLHREIKVAAALSSGCSDPPPEFLRSSPEARRKLSHRIPTAPSRSPAASSTPAFALPPLVGTLPPEPEFHAPTPTSVGPPLLPHISPMANPASPTYGPRLPPCEPPRSAAPAPAHTHHHGAWCVAKPSVPAETLQEALDYACGEGEADCEAIKEDGDCFYPDNLVAHASYAFNSYWQKTKSNDGSCGFGGTAMLISSDPSYGRCRFSLSEMEMELEFRWVFSLIIRYHILSCDE